MTGVNFERLRGTAKVFVKFNQSFDMTQICNVIQIPLNTNKMVILTTYHERLYNREPKQGVNHALRAK